MMERLCQNLPVPTALLEFARELRARETDAERLLRGMVRNRRFLGLKFRRQFPCEGYLLDLYCHELKWAVESDGGQHNSTEKRRADERRTAALSSCGIVVTRFWNHEVLESLEAVLEEMCRVAERLRNQTTK